MKKVTLVKKNSRKVDYKLVKLYNSAETGKTNNCTCDKCNCDKCVCDKCSC